MCVADKDIKYNSNKIVKMLKSLNTYDAKIRAKYYIFCINIHTHVHARIHTHMHKLIRLHEELLNHKTY